MRGTAIFWATVIPIVFVGAVLYVIYKIRRASQERRQRSSEREAALLANLQQLAPSAARQAQPSHEAPQSTPPPAALVAGSATPAPAAPAALRRRARIVSESQRLLFLVLRAAMPEHFIMAHVRLVDLLDLPDATDIERDLRLRTLARERLDFVVCDSDLAPVAAIVLYAAGIERVPDESAKVEALRGIGVRFLRLRADRLPRPAELRNLVLA